MTTEIKAIVKCKTTNVIAIPIIAWVKVKRPLCKNAK